MRFLRVFRLRLVVSGGVRQVAFAELALDLPAALSDGLGHDLHPVRSHISDEAHGLAADVDALIKPLRDLHGLARRKAQLARRLLLKRRRREGRRGIALVLLRLDAFDAEGLSADRIAISVRCRLVRNVEFVELLAAARHEACLDLLIGGRAKDGFDRPIFAGLERFDLRLAVHHEAKRHRLHPACRARARQFPPEHGRKREAHEIVERAAGEVSVNQRLVDGARMGERCQDRVFRDRVERDALHRDAAQGALLLQDFEKMP